MNLSSPAGWAWPAWSEVPRAQQRHRGAPRCSLAFFTEQKKPRSVFSSLQKWSSVTSLNQQPRPHWGTSAFPQSPAGWRPSSQGASDDWGVERHWFDDSLCSAGHQCRMARTHMWTAAGSHTEYCAPPSNYRWAPCVGLSHLDTFITVYILRTPNGRRVRGEVRLLSGVWPQKALWGWLSKHQAQNLLPTKGCACKYFGCFQLGPSRNHLASSPRSVAQISSSWPLTLRQVESYQRLDPLP